MGEFQITDIWLNPAALEVAQTEALEATMFICHTGDGIKGQLGNPGHASILLRRTRDQGYWTVKQTTRRVGRKTHLQNDCNPPYDDTKMRYISFWPDGQGARGAVFLPHHLRDFAKELGEGADRALVGGGAPRPGQIVLGTDGGGNDVWGQKPQETIKIPALTRQRRRSLGVHMGKMVDWAIDFKNGAEFDYRFISTQRNCAGVAVRALCAGGGDAFARVGGNPRRGLIYFTPSDARQWGGAVFRSVNKVNDMLDALRNNPRAPKVQRLGGNLQAVGADLPTVREWKDSSKISALARGSLTRAVDSALEAYHSVSWDGDFPKRLDALVKVIVGVHTHVQHFNERSPAYWWLAGTILSVVEDLAGKGDESWPETSFVDRGV